MKTSLRKEWVKIFKDASKVREKDERLMAANSRVLSTGMLCLIALFSVYAILMDTLRVRWEVELPFTFFQQITFLLGMVCFGCALALCRNCALSGFSFAIFIAGIGYPSFLLAQLPVVLFPAQEKFTSLLALVLIPVFCLIFYFILDAAYRAAVRRLEGED